MGNPLVGWLVTFDPPNGLSIPFSASSVRTNDLGIAAISADSSALSSEAILTVRSGSGTVWFRGSAAGFVPYYRDGLPNTGFAPGVRTFLPPQPAGKVYQAEANLPRALLAFEAACQIPDSLYRACLELATLELKNRHYSKTVDYLERALAIQKTAPVEDFLARVKPLLAAQPDKI